MGESNPKEQVQSIREKLFIKIVDGAIIAGAGVLGGVFLQVVFND